MPAIRGLGGREFLGDQMTLISRGPMLFYSESLYYMVYEPDTLLGFISSLRLMQHSTTKP